MWINIIDKDVNSVHTLQWEIFLSGMVHESSPRPQKSFIFRHFCCLFACIVSVTHPVSSFTLMFQDYNLSSVELCHCSDAHNEWITRPVVEFTPPGWLRMKKNVHLLVKMKLMSAVCRMLRPHWFMSGCALTALKMMRLMLLIWSLLGPSALPKISSEVSGGLKESVLFVGFLPTFSDRASVRYHCF